MLRPLISISLLLSLVACGDKDVGGVGSPPVLPGGDTGLSVDGDGDGDIDDGDAVDADADGFAAPDDCDDNDPLVNRCH